MSRFLDIWETKRILEIVSNGKGPGLVRASSASIYIVSEPPLENVYTNHCLTSALWHVLAIIHEG
jgi:hypothetical protein